MTLTVISNTHVAITLGSPLARHKYIFIVLPIMETLIKCVVPKQVR